jgi:RIO-like serine/threonine protein kinase
MKWPDLQDYNEAVQNPELSFEDGELRQGEVELTPLGLPKVASGNFAGVYRFKCGSKYYAVKCFHRNVFDLHQRYAHLTQFTQVTSVSSMVTFEYQLKGIYIDENWFPIVKMDWVNGLCLDQFLRKNWSNRQAIDRLIEQFVKVIAELERVGVAHCDLQHGNVLVSNDRVLLVDYDGMFVPAMAGLESKELGHPNYQHLDRRTAKFGPELDSFSAWIIYYSLLFLKLDPSLWQKYGGGEDCLLFRKSDFENPEQSRLLKEIANHPIPEIRQCIAPVKALLSRSSSSSPRFGKTLCGPSNASGLLVGTGRNSSVVQPAKSVAIPSSIIYPARWPSCEQYFRAASSAEDAFKDENLKNCAVTVTFGKNSDYFDADSTIFENLPFDKAVVRGRRHMVMRLTSNETKKQYAVKCFLDNVPDRQVRYEALHKYKKAASNRYFVPFVYQSQGIRVNAHWLPLVKMLWVEGEALDQYVRKQIATGAIGVLEELPLKFAKLCAALADDGIAHADLEPGNILVDSFGDLRIVDYDGIYVPPLASLSSCEIGYSPFQHPTRNRTHFGPYLDNYSALLVYGLLRCFVRRPEIEQTNWESLVQKLRNSGMAAPKVRTTQADSRYPKWDHDMGFCSASFEKANEADSRDELSYEEAFARLAKVLKEQQRYRVDQVARLNVVMWNLP